MMAGAYLQIQEANRGRFPFTHEFAHALGFDHGENGYAGVPLPSVMGRIVDYPTTADILHGRILYRRPAGSRSPDRDPEATMSLRTGALVMRVVR